MSQYPKYFIQPTFRGEELDELYSTGEVQKKVHLPCRPPLNDQTSSQFFHADSRCVKAYQLSSIILRNIHSSQNQNFAPYRKFINHIMRKGKKELARDLLDKVLC
jgi:hypothetical protein